MDLEARANWLRKQVFEMSARARQGHLASVLSEIEILVALYYGGVLNCDPKDPDRDRVIVSKGHATMGLYPILADKGYFPKSELEKYGTFDGNLKIFGNIDIPGIDATTGSLGHGIGIACGYCLAAKRDNKKSRTFVILSEGEMYEGSVWESALFAAHNNLDNLIVILDRNHKIILGDTEECVRLEPIKDKWESFGWNTFVAEGHSHGDLLEIFHSIERGNRHTSKVILAPSVIIAETVKGKGLSFMEGRPEWHYTNLTNELIEQGRRELNASA